MDDDIDCCFISRVSNGAWIVAVESDENNGFDILAAFLKTADLIAWLEFHLSEDE